MKYRTAAIVLTLVLVLAVVAPIAPAYAAGHPALKAPGGGSWASEAAVSSPIVSAWHWLLSLWNADGGTPDPNGSATGLVPFRESHRALVPAPDQSRRLRS